MDKNHFQIIVRSCPISSEEVVSQKPSRCLRAEGDHSLRWSDLSRDASFTFDNIIRENASQEELFFKAGLPIVDTCMAVYSTCMFAYGQTGTGKTYTMFGDIDHIGGGVSENRGMIPRVFEKLFSRIQLEEEQRKDENLKYSIECSFLEIYEEKIADLLELASTNLQDLSKIVVNDVQDIMLLLEISEQENGNQEQHQKVESFPWQDTCAVEGKVLNKASKINISISHLRLVVKCVFDVANGKKVHIAYRNSKLTYFLEDSPGVNSRIILIATVSPANNSDDTLNTLKFAQQFRPLRSIQQRTKLLPAEMEQRRCLTKTRFSFLGSLSTMNHTSLMHVDQREAKMWAKEWVFGDSDLVDQEKMLTEELEVMQEKVDRNLREQICRSARVPVMSMGLLWSAGNLDLEKALKAYLPVLLGLVTGGQEARNSPQQLNILGGMWTTRARSALPFHQSTPKCLDISL